MFIKILPLHQIHLHLFLSFSNQIQSLSGSVKFDENSPLSDYYFSKSEWELFNNIQNSNLDISLSIIDCLTLIKKIEDHIIPYSPKLTSELVLLKSKSFSKFLKRGMSLVDKVYGDEYSKVIGIKEVWTNEFSPLFIQNFNNAKVVHIIRDPRAVAASNYAKKGQKYPLLFLARQWRKLASLSAYYRSIDCNNFILKYEDLIKNPEKEVRKLCKFLEIDFDYSLINPSNFVDGLGESGLKTHPTKNLKKKFNTKSIEKWRFVLNQDQINFLEQLCFLEMQFFDYESSFKSFSLSKKDFKINNSKDSEYAEWIKPYTIYDFDAELQNELNRYNAINKEKLSSSRLRKYFLREEIYNLIKKVNKIVMIKNLLTKPYIIAEAGINHNGDFKLALELIEQAAKTNANAIKFQNYLTEDFIFDSSLKFTYKSNGQKITEPMYDLCKRCEMPRNWIPKLKNYCDQLGIDFLSTPTNTNGIDDLINVGVAMLKNGSDYLTHLPLLAEMSKTGLPIILSTGMANKDEIEDSLKSDK